MRSWKPDPQESLRERRALAEKTTASVRAFLGCAGPRHQEALRAAWRGNDDDLSVVLHPDFFFWHFRLARAFTDEDTAQLATLAGQLDSVLQSVTRSREHAVANRALLGI